MTDRFGESLSAFIDGELSAKEAAVLLEKLRVDRELQKRWERYQLVGDAIRHNLPEYISLGMAEKLSTALQNEPPLLAPRPAVRENLPLVKPVIGFAIAASVAGTAIWGLQSLTQEAIEPIPSVAQSDPTPSMAQPAVQSKLNRYLANHYEYAPTNGMKGMLPYVIAVGHDAKR